MNKCEIQTFDLINEIKMLNEFEKRHISLFFFDFLDPSNTESESLMK